MCELLVLLHQYYTMLMCGSTQAIGVTDWCIKNIETCRIRKGGDAIKCFVLYLVSSQKRNQEGGKAIVLCSTWYA